MVKHIKQNKGEGEMYLQSKYKAWISKLLVVSFMIFIVGESRFSYSNVGNPTPTHTATGTPTITPTPTLDPWMTVTATQTHTPSTPTLTPTKTPIPQLSFADCWLNCMQGHYPGITETIGSTVLGCLFGIYQISQGQCPTSTVFLGLFTSFKSCLQTGGVGVGLYLTATFGMDSLGCACGCS